MGVGSWELGDTYIHPPDSPVAHIYTDPRIQVPRRIMLLKCNVENQFMQCFPERASQRKAGSWELCAGSWELGAWGCALGERAVSWEVGAGGWELGAGRWELGAGGWEL